MSGSPSRLVGAGAEIKPRRSHEYKRGVGLVVAAEMDGRRRSTSSSSSVVAPRQFTAPPWTGCLARWRRSARKATLAETKLHNTPKYSLESIETIRFIDRYNRGAVKIIRPLDTYISKDFSRLGAQ